MTTWAWWMGVWDWQLQMLGTGSCKWVYDIKKNNAQQCTVWPGMNSSFNCDKSSCCSLNGLRVGEDGISNKCGSQCPILPGFVSHWPRFSDCAVISQCKQLSLKLRHLWWLTHCSQQIQWHCDHAITPTTTQRCSAPNLTGAEFKPGIQRNHSHICIETWLKFLFHIGHSELWIIPI